MNTTYYIEDKNGKYISANGTTRYRSLSGKELYEYLQTEEGKSRCFYTDAYTYYDILEDFYDDVIGIEVNQQEMLKIYKIKNHSAYLNRQKDKKDLKFISGYESIRDCETPTTIFETIEDTTINVEDAVINSIASSDLKKALEHLSEEEYYLIYKLFLSNNSLTQAQLAQEFGVSQQEISRKKKKILKKLKKFLENHL